MIVGFDFFSETRESQKSPLKIQKLEMRGESQMGSVGGIQQNNSITNSIKSNNQFSLLPNYQPWQQLANNSGILFHASLDIPIKITRVYVGCVKHEIIDLNSKLQSTNWLLLFLFLFSRIQKFRIFDLKVMRILKKIRLQLPWFFC